MSETIATLVTSYGVYVIFTSAFLSCLALPIPTSLMMLSGGAFVATGDLTLFSVMGAAYLGAVIGDQAGFAIGRFGGMPLTRKIARTATRRKVLERARRTVDKHGGFGVFLSTWLFAPLGPWVNLAAGTAGMGWARFAVWDILGETIWVTVYVGLGMTFASQVSTVADIMGNIMGLLAALALAGAMAWWIRGALRQHRENNRTGKITAV